MALLPQPVTARTSPPHHVDRLFFALWPDASLRRRAAEATTSLASARGIRGRRLRPERYHLTLHFLGDFAPLPPSLVAAAIAAADEVRAAAFELLLDRAGSFGGTRVGWLGPSDTPAGLQVLWTTLRQALERHGVPPPCLSTTTGVAIPGMTTHWTPHLTVLRGMRQPLPATAIAPLAWSVDGFVLIRSQPGQGDYAVLHRWPLQV